MLQKTPRRRYPTQSTFHYPLSCALRSWADLGYTPVSEIELSTTVKEQNVDRTPYCLHVITLARDVCGRGHGSCVVYVSDLFLCKLCSEFLYYAVCMKTIMKYGLYNSDQTYTIWNAKSNSIKL